jgi:hypothetical protein
VSDARLVAKFCRLFSRMEKSDLELVLPMAQRWRGGTQLDDSVLPSAVK